MRSTYLEFNDPQAAGLKAGISPSMRVVTFCLLLLISGASSTISARAPLSPHAASAGSPRGTSVTPEYAKYTPDEAKRLTLRAFMIFAADWGTSLGLLLVLLFTGTLSRLRRRWTEVLAGRLRGGRLDRALILAQTWLAKENEKHYRINLLAGRERRWRERLRRRALSGRRDNRWRKKLIASRRAFWRDKLRHRVSKARQRKRLKRFEQLTERRRRRIYGRVIKITATARDALITSGGVVLGLFSVSVIFDVIRYFNGYRIPTDAYIIWSKLYIPERVAINCLLAVVLVAFYILLDAFKGANTFRKKAAVGCLCGAMTLVYIHANFKVPKNHKHDDGVTAPLIGAPDVAPENMAAAFATAALYRIDNRQLFIVRGKGGGLLNAYTLGYGPEAKISFTERLLREMRPQQLAFVTAHEMGHAYDPAYNSERNRYLMFAIGGICIFMACLTWAGLSLAPSGLLKRPFKAQSGMLICLLLVNIFMLMLPALDNVLSWRAESYTDSFASELTITDEASRQAALDVFAQLAEGSQFDPDPPFIIQLMFNDHPSTVERLQEVRDYRIPTANDGDVMP